MTETRSLAKTGKPGGNPGKESPLPKTTPPDRAGRSLSGQESDLDLKIEGPVQSPAPEATLPESIREKKVHLFIHDQVLPQQSRWALNKLGFQEIGETRVKPGYFEAVRQLPALLSSRPDLVLVNPPLALGPVGKRVTKEFRDFFSDVSLLLSRTGADPMDRLSLCVPLFTEAQLTEIRERFLLSLAEYGVTGAFILAKQDSLLGLRGESKEEALRDHLEQRKGEIRSYLEEYFQDRDQALERLKARREMHLEEEELTRRRQEAEKWMREGQQLKKSGNYEQAVKCYKRAIEALPDSPEPYLESGRSHVKLRQYPLALRRFKEAGQVAEELPIPDKEIGVMRVQQVQELMGQGYPASHERVVVFLGQAAVHFQRSLDKAARITPLHKGDDPRRGERSVMEVTNTILKTNLTELLGPRHPMAQKISAMTTEAMAKHGPGETQEPAPLQLIGTGWHLFNTGKLSEAEQHCFQAAEAEDFFQTACREINSLAVRLRTKAGPDEAIRLYRRLLELGPPNRAAINFNLAVSWRQKNNLIEASGALVEAVFIEPYLPLDSDFKKQEEIVKLYHWSADLYAKLDEELKEMRIPPKLRNYFHLLGALENLLAKDGEKAAVLLRRIIDQAPGFFELPEVYGRKGVMDLVNLEFKRARVRDEDQGPGRSDALAKVLKQKEQIMVPRKIAAFNQLTDHTLKTLVAEGDEPRAASLLTKAAVICPICVTTPAFNANQNLTQMVRKIRDKLGTGRKHESRPAKSKDRGQPLE